jgi:Glycosyl hydrolases family 2, TIM barrel domain
MWSEGTDARIASLSPRCCVSSHVHHVQVGFRQVELGDRALLVNKRRIWVRGVNRHEHDPLRGKAVTEAGMLQVQGLLTLDGYSPGCFWTVAGPMFMHMLIHIQHR